MRNSTSRIVGFKTLNYLENIIEYEGIKRNIYTGSIGYFDFRGNCDFNIAIRTIIKKDNKAFFGVVVELLMIQ